MPDSQELYQYLSHNIHNDVFVPKTAMAMCRKILLVNTFEVILLVDGVDSIE